MVRNMFFLSTACQESIEIFKSSSWTRQRPGTLARFGQSSGPCPNSWTPCGLTLRDSQVTRASVFPF